MCRGGTLVGEPLFAQNLLNDGVVGDGIHNGIDAASGLETYLYARFIVVFLDSLAHNVCCLRSSGRLHLPVEVLM